MSDLQELKRVQLAAGNVDSLLKRSASDFYQYSFYNRSSAKAEFQILGLVSNAKGLSQAEKALAVSQRKCIAEFLLRDAEIGDVTGKSELQDYVAAVEALKKQQQDAQTAYQKMLLKLHEDWQDFVATPWHISSIIDLLSVLNLYRLLLLFSRLHVKAFWLLAHEKNWLDMQDRILGHTINRALLDIPVDAFNALSVTLFLLRFIANVYLIIKHACSKREGEKDIDWKDRRDREIHDRLQSMMNDFPWMFINLITNYAKIFHISDPVANILLTVTLFYDTFSLGIHWYRQECEWAKKHQELNEWDGFLAQYQGNAFFNFGGTPLQTHKNLSEKSLLAEKDLLFQTRVKFAYCIAAGLTIVSSYVAILALGSLQFSPVGFLICIIGFGMYATGDEFSAWMRAKFGKIKGADIKVNGEMKTEEEVTGWKFANALGKAILQPLVVVTLLPIAWQLAVLATVMFAVQPYLEMYFKSSDDPGAGQNDEGIVSRNIRV